MASNIEHVEKFGPEWNGRAVVAFNGQLDTHIKTGEDYDTLTLAAIFTAEPGDQEKARGRAFIPSLYHDFDAREHAVQRARGQFVALCGDIDSGDNSIARIERLVRGFVGDAAWLIYSSSHARPGDMRWRVVIPLAEPLGFDGWYDAQHAFFNFMEVAGVAMDRALDRAGQPVYLPNVPEAHGKSREPLRGDDGSPLYYERATSGTAAPGINPDAGPLAAGITQIHRKRAEDDLERDRLKVAALARRRNLPASDDTNIIATFNQNNTIATMLEVYGYQQSARHSEDWRSPHQSGESYATRIMGDKWVSLSTSDASARVGSSCKSGCYGDAYDLYVHFEHSGQHKAAFRALHAERKASAGAFVHHHEPEREYDPETGEPLGEPPADWDDEATETGDPDATEPQEADESPSLPVTHPADWAGTAPPVRQWRWDNFMPDYQATLLTGAGAAGKSLAMQQMATCVAMGLHFLGVPTKGCPALYITCEDDLEELHRRQDAICASLGVSLESTRGRLFLLSLQGQVENELARFDQEGKMTVTPRYGEIEQTCIALGVGHVTIDNTAHTFAGNENDRHQVAAFVNLNNKLAQAIGGSVVMVGHPNKAGDSYSGSTAWENQVRSRIYLEIPKGDGGTSIDPDMRVLRNEKANYSQRGSEVTFYWFKGAFVTQDQIPKDASGDVRQTAKAAWENDLFLDLLDKLTLQRRHVSHAANLSNFAPKVMAGMPEACGTNHGAFKRAMERLFAADEIEASKALWDRANRHPAFGIARKS